MKTILALVLTLFVTSFAQASVALVETYGDRIVTIREANMVTVKTVASGTFTARGKVDMIEQDFSVVLASNTRVALAIGQWSYEGVLGNDPKFVPNKSKSVTLNLPRGGTIRIAFTPKAVTWSVTAKTGETQSGGELETPAIAQQLYMDENTTITAADNRYADCSLTHGENTVSGLMAIAGTGRFGYKKARLGPTIQEYPVRTVRMTGKGTLGRN